MYQESEKQLIASIKADPSRFSVVFDKYYSAIFRYVIRRGLDYNTSCDIVSETFLKAFIKIGTFEWKGISLSFWLYRIATNEIQQYFRKKRYLPESLSSLIDSSGWDIVDPKTTIEEKLQLEKELLIHPDFLSIQAKLKTLPVKYQEVLTLRIPPTEHRSK